MHLARQGYHEPFDKALWWVHTHTHTHRSRYKYSLLNFNFVAPYPHEPLPYCMARRLIQMLKYCCICWVKFIYNSANTLKQCNWINTPPHTHMRAYGNQLNQTRENWKQNKNDNENDDATQKPGKHATNGITKTSKTPNWATNLANKNGELNQIEWQWKRLPATWTSMPCTFTFKTTQRQRWNPLDRIIVTGASRTL